MFLNLIIRFFIDDSSIVDVSTTKSRITFDIYDFVSIAEFLIVVIKESNSFAFNALKRNKLIFFRNFLNLILFFSRVFSFYNWISFSITSTFCFIWRRRIDVLLSFLFRRRRFCLNFDKISVLYVNSSRIVSLSCKKNDSTKSKTDFDIFTARVFWDETNLNDSDMSICLFDNVSYVKSECISNVYRIVTS